jgi:hypothetical protein
MASHKNSILGKQFEIFWNKIIIGEKEKKHKQPDGK